MLNRRQKREIVDGLKLLIEDAMKEIGKTGDNA